MLKTIWKGVEFAGHTAFVFAPAVLLDTLWSDAPVWATWGLLGASYVAMLGREVRQNLGDDPEGAPVWLGIPINADLITDLVGYTLGLAGAAGWLIWA